MSSWERRKRAKEEKKKKEGEDENEGSGLFLPSAGDHELKEMEEFKKKGTPKGEEKSRTAHKLRHTFHCLLLDIIPIGNAQNKPEGKIEGRGEKKEKRGEGKKKKKLSTSALSDRRLSPLPFSGKNGRRKGLRKIEKGEKKGKGCR